MLNCFSSARIVVAGHAGYVRLLRSLRLGLEPVRTIRATEEPRRPSRPAAIIWPVMTGGTRSKLTSPLPSTSPRSSNPQKRLFLLEKKSAGISFRDNVCPTLK